MNLSTNRKSDERVSRRNALTRALMVAGLPLLPRAAHSQTPVRKIFAVSYRCLYSADKDFLLMHELLRRVGKPSPRICYMPVAHGDDPARIAFWYETMQKFSCVPRHQRVFIGTSDYPDWETELLAADCIFVGGGNTLNTIAIWRAQGIDKVLRQAWERGIVMAGESAGAICWFERGSTDSRPGRLSATDGLGFLKGTLVPHLDNSGREETMMSMEKSGDLGDGYAYDEGAAFWIENDKIVEAVKNRPEARVFTVRGGSQPTLAPMEARLLKA